MRVFESVDELKKNVGEVIGTSDWHTVTQQQIDTFAEATGDHQWIHVDAEAAAKGPYGTTIAHGYLTLSMIPMLASSVSRVDGVRMGVNYGLNKVRFPNVVPVGSKVRASVRLKSVDDVDGGVQITNEVTVEREDSEKPCCVAETVARIYL